MLVLVTGAAGFIGYHAAKRLLAAGHEVIGVDSLNSYYDVTLKHSRLAQLRTKAGFTFYELDLSDPNALTKLEGRAVTHVLHLAAQAGVRYSVENPHSYVQSNVMGHLNVLEFARHSKSVEHVAYASSSSVYGEREAGAGFLETDRVREPASLYAATKLSAELISESYSKLYLIPQTGLRFFTVYGPWGRPDMAYWIFTKKIFDGDAITLFAPDKMVRDFTYIEDIVDILPKLLVSPPNGHAIYNLGNANPNLLVDLVISVEKACGRKAEKITLPQQPGDVRVTFADSTAARQAFGFAPKMKLDDGIANFVNWYRLWSETGATTEVPR